ALPPAIDTCRKRPSPIAARKCTVNPAHAGCTAQPANQCPASGDMLWRDRECHCRRGSNSRCTCEPVVSLCPVRDQRRCTGNCFQHYCAAAENSTTPACLLAAPVSPV